MSRQKLLGAATKVFAELGFRGATTRRIAEVAGVNEVTLFRHFGSKSQLMVEALESLHPIPGVSLPDHPGAVERELVAWATAHLQGMRQIRHIIRKTMAELEEHPEMTPVICDAKTPYFRDLVTYATKVRRPATVAQREEVRTACTMLSSALFSDAMGRDVVPSTYPSPAESAPRKYVRVFLKLLGAEPKRAARLRPAAGVSRGRQMRRPA